MMPSHTFFIVSLISFTAAAQQLHIKVRSRVQAFKNGPEWVAVDVPSDFTVKQTAIVICDMWDNHWCKGASQRVGELADRMDPVLVQARKLGILIIHAPSETMDFYKDAPQRKLMLALERVEPPPALGLIDPPLPIDDKSGGCDTHDSFFKAWKRENAKLHIADNDVVSDKGTEIYSLLRLRGINNVLFMGVHTNMCVLNRTFAIKQMTKWGVRSVLIRDLTDAMYDPQARPFVSHEQGTELVIEHIEKYWCPTALSKDIR